ncbi:MAG: hypothetical protein EOO75_05265 [Myxococcales bacterium]|nr:MAG: hypothetical protein EOO75_05265 [Myxococcales bacterium]
MTTSLTTPVLDAPAFLRLLWTSRLLLVLTSLGRVLARSLRGRRPARVESSAAAPARPRPAAPAPAPSVRPCQLVLF